MDVVKTKKEENGVNTLNLQGQPIDAKPVLRETESIAYRELPGLRHETKDVLQQLQSNIQMLEDLGGRLSYMMGEIRSLIRR